MTVLTIKTDQPESELALVIDGVLVGTYSWEADRQLAETIHKNIDLLLTEHHIKLNDLDGIVCYKGPGSFTGLRIGMSVGNALAYSLNLPISVANDDDWQQTGAALLKDGGYDKSVLPEYGGEIHITKPRK